MNQAATQPLERLLAQEQGVFAARHPESQLRFHRGQAHYLYGSPSHWMRRWAGGFPVYVESARGARVRCVDGFDYVDFCLGDTGAMCGHAPPAITAAVTGQLERGATLMLPTADAQWVGEELARRFGLPFWGFTTSATDANRAAIRMCRMLTERPRVLVFNGCYHGCVEEAHVEIRDGKVGLRNGIHPNAVDHARVSAVVEFNDLASLEKTLETREVACVLTEPFMTNYGMVLPQAGFHRALRELTRRTGTFLIVDETHTLSSGTGGYTRLQGLEPDMLVLGKAVGGGIPVGLFGVTRAVGERMWSLVPKVNPATVKQSSHLGFGGTLAGSALQVAAVRVVLEMVLVEAAYERMITLAEDLAEGARTVVRRFALPWHVEQCGARVEIMFAANAPRNAGDVARGRNALLESLLHVFFMNRGVLITPFHCMLLISPATERVAVERFIEVFAEFGQTLSEACAADIRTGGVA